MDFDEGVGIVVGIENCAVVVCGRLVAGLAGILAGRLVGRLVPTKEWDKHGE